MYIGRLFILDISWGYQDSGRFSIKFDTIMKKRVINYNKIIIFTLSMNVKNIKFDRNTSSTEAQSPKKEVNTLTTVPLQLGARKKNI